MGESIDKRESVAMKAIITGVLTAAVTVVSIAVPAGATSGIGASGSIAASSSMVSSYSMGFGPNGIYFNATGASCLSTSANASYTFGDASATDAQAASSSTGNCNADQVVTNPPANSTVTINGVCGDPTELAKIEAEHANLIINSVGPCPTTPVQTTPVTVVVTSNAPEANGNVQTASATTSSPVATSSELPHTGIDGAMASAVTAGLAVISYAGTMAIRALRARA